MMYNDVDNDLPPFNDTIDGEEIFLFSSANNKSSSNNGSSFLHEDVDEYLRHQHNVVASTSSHLPVDVDELLLNSNFLEQPNCDQSVDPLFWNCKDISDDHLNEFLPQTQLNLSNNPIVNNLVAIHDPNQIQPQQQPQPPQHHLIQQHHQQQLHLQQTHQVNLQQQTTHSQQPQQTHIQQPQQQLQQQQIYIQVAPAQTQQQPQQQQILHHQQQQQLHLQQQQQQQQQQQLILQQQQQQAQLQQQQAHQQQQIYIQVAPPAQSQQPQPQTPQQVSPPQPSQPQPQSIKTTIPPSQQEFLDVKPKVSVPASNSTTKKDVHVKQKSKEKQTRLDCPYCKRSFSKNFDLQQHMRCHTGEKPFQCIVCGRGFAQKSNVKKHMQAHKVWPEGPNNTLLPSDHGNARSRNNSASSSIGTPRDDDCMQENESLQINHDNNVNNNGISLGLSNDRKNNGSDIFADQRYSCSYCPFNGRTYFELKSHLTIHKREKVFKCIVSSCGKTFSGSDLQGFLDHVTGHKDLIYHCHSCSGQFYSLDEFGEHQKHHSDAQIKRTSQTQSQNSSQVVLNQQNNVSLRQQNQQVATNQLQQQQNQRQYNQNQQAGHQLSSSTKNSQLYISQPTKNNQKYFRCSKCMNRYRTQAALDHHLSISTHNFPCTECNKIFMCERYLRRHLNTHTTVHHVCTFCDKQFKTAAYLKMHSVVHTGEKPFRCNLCEAAFNRRDKLNRHKLTHETVKKYKCPFKPHIGCTKEFNRPDKLKAHVLTHSGIRPHPCDVCSRTFSRLSRLREHKKSHHDNNTKIANSGGCGSSSSTTVSIQLKEEVC